MLARFALFAFLVSPLALAQFPKAYLADAVAGPALLPPGEGTDARKLLILEPSGLAIDAQNNIYVSDEKFNRVLRITPSGAFSTYAGTGAYGGFRAGVPANESGLAAPKGIAFDRAGNLFIANQYASTIVRVAADRTTSIYAGGGSATGDGRAPLETRLGQVEYLAADAQGNVYFSEFRGFKVRKIPAGGGAIETYAGTGTEGSSEQNGPARQIPLGWIEGLFVGADNNLYILDGAGGVIRRITPEGTSTFVFRSSDVPMKSKPAGWTVSQMTGIAADADGTLWFAAYFWQSSVSLLKCPGRKDCEIVAGGGAAGFNGDGSPATQKRLSLPGAVAKDGQGNVVFTDGQRVRLLTPAGELRTVAGGDTFAARGDGQKNANAVIESSQGIAVDSQNNVYASDLRNHQVWRFGADGTARIVAGSGTRGYSGDNGPATAAELSEPGALAVDASGNLYILDIQNYVVRKVTPQGVITTHAGRSHSVTANCAPNPATAPAAQWCFTIPSSLAADTQGNVFVGDYNAVVRVAAGTVTPVAPTGRTECLHAGSDGNLYAVANNQVLRSAQGASAFTVIAGTGKATSTGDGGPALAADIYATSVALDANRNILVGDFAGRKLRAITADGKIQTIAGGGTKIGTSAAGGPSTDARVAPPQLAAGRNGRIYYCDPGFSSNIPSNIHVWSLEPAQLFRTGVLNAASYAAGPVAGGEMVTIYGIDIGPPTLAIYQIVDNKFRDEIASTRVLFDGVRAPIIYVSATAASVVVPYAVAGKTETEMWIEYQGVATNRVKLPVAATKPGIFTIPPTGTGQAALLHWPDYGANNAANPIAREGVGMLFLTGGGDQGQDGMLAQTTGALPFPVTVRVGTTDAQVLYAGPAPSLVYGMLQINFVVPPNTTPGDKVALFVRLGETWSQSGITISVK